MSLEILALHMLGDFVFQTDWMAIHKFTNVRARLAHVLAYSTLFFVWGSLLYGFAGFSFAVCVAFTHFITDSQRLYTSHSWGPKGILVDQTIHIVTLAILSRLFLGGGVYGS